jgi:two-component system, cell cycle response regulator
MVNSGSHARPPLVLLVNDQEWWARSLESLLAANGYAVLRAYSGEQALAAAHTGRPDAIFIELHLPDMDGAELCRLLQKNPEVGVSVPIVLTTSGATERERKLAAYQCGAWEFVSEPLDGELLMVRLGNLLKARQEIERFRSESLLDDLTGLYNLQGLARRAREMGAEAQRRRDSFSCVAVAPWADIAAGENAARTPSSLITEQLGDLVRRVVRTSDAVGRLGRAEFAIVALGTESVGAARLAQRLQEAVDEAQLIPEPDGLVLKVSAGYYAVNDLAQAAVDPVEVLVRATSALRDARASRASAEIRAYQEPTLRRSSDPSRGSPNLYA